VTNPSKTRIATVLFILLLPWLFYFALKGGKHNFTRLEYFGPKIPVTKQVDGKEITDTIYHQLKDFSLVDEDGNTFSSDEIKKRFTVVSVFNSDCTECLSVFEKLFFVQDEFKEADDVQIISITNLPQKDSVVALKKFIEGKHVKPPKWKLLTGDSTQIKNLLLESFFVTTFKNNISNYDQVYLVDKQKHLRGIYDGTNEVEIHRIFDEIKVLRLEEREVSKDKGR
jgi:protein SCO1/2